MIFDTQGELSIDREDISVDHIKEWVCNFAAVITWIQLKSTFGRHFVMYIQQNNVSDPVGYKRTWFSNTVLGSSGKSQMHGRLWLIIRKMVHSTDAF
jgi:hypothetical protein